MANNSEPIFVPPNSTFTSDNADTIVAGGSDTITMLAPGALAFGLTADAITAEAADTIVGAVPPTTIPFGGTLPVAETISAAAPGALLWSAGNTEVVNTGGADTIVSQPSQISIAPFISSPVADTIFAAAGGGTYFIEGPDTFVAGSEGSSTVVGGDSFSFSSRFSDPVPPTIFGGAESVLYFAQPIQEGRFPVQLGIPTFIFDPQSGDSTIVTTTSMVDSATGAINTGAGEAFVHNGGILNVVGSGSANQLVAGEGSATINAAGSTGYNTFFASSGNSSLIGGSGLDAVSAVDLPSSVRALFEANLFEGSSGSTTMVGGAGANFFQFVSGHAGGSDLIQNWNSNDQLQFFGYDGNPIASQGVSSGSTVITLTDGTHTERPKC
jgi:hypothetical protein